MARVSFPNQKLLRAQCNCGAHSAQKRHGPTGGIGWWQREQPPGTRRARETHTAQIKLSGARIDTPPLQTMQALGIRNRSSATRLRAIMVREPAPRLPT